MTKFGLFFSNANATVEAPQVLGARSFSVWNSSGALVWDSGDQFEQFFAIYGNVAAPGDGALKFNSTHSENAPDTRSDNKGPEPESIVTGMVDGRTYAFVGLERIGGVTGWLRAAAIAHSHDVPLSSHLFPEFSSHLLSVTPTRHWLEYVDWANPVLQHPVEVVDGHAIISDRPGSGIVWNEDAIAKYIQ